MAQQYDTRLRIGIFTALGIAGPVGFLISPFIVEMMGSRFGWNEQQLGGLASAELAGLAVASMTALFWAKKAPWRPVILVCLIGLVLGNLMSIKITEYVPLISLRFVLGLLGGAMMAIYVTFLSYTRDPDRNASILIFCQVSFQVLSFILIPLIGARFGLPGLFSFIALLYVPFLLLFKLLPPSTPEGTKAVQSGQKAEVISLRRQWPGISILIAAGLFFITQVGVWAFFLTDVGPHQNVTPEQAIQVLTWSTGIALLGPLASFFIRERFGRRLPLALPALGQVVLLYVMAKGGLSFTGFLIFASLFQIFWNFMLAYIFAAMVEADTTHRLISLVPTAQALGIAAGPILVGSFMTEYGIWAIAGIGALSLFAYLLFILPYARRHYIKSND